MVGGDNMFFVYGLLTAVAFFVVLIATFIIAYRYGRKNHVPKLIKEEDEKRQKFDEHFKALFSYDVETALQKKKVM